MKITPSDAHGAWTATHSRRGVLIGAGLAAASLSACDLFTTDPAREGTGGSENGASKGKEAPELAAQVKSGQLAPLRDRLPDNPLVVRPVERMGVYGGTWRTALLGAADKAWLHRTIGYEALTRWDPTATKVVPSVAESIDTSSDAREFTITLRPGMRWSDGEPFTADDLMFAYEDVLLNTDLTPVLPEAFTTASGQGRMEKVDDHTVRLTFDRPNGTLLTRLALTAGWDSGGLTGHPRHYLEQFHIKYAPDANEQAKEQGHADWIALFDLRADPFANSDLPTLHAWVLTTELGESNQAVAERNPYYWKVDPDGNQLPYIDEVVFDVIADEETILLRATNGELSFHTRHINSLANKPVLARNRDKGNYHFMTLKNTFMNEMYIALNLNHEDPALRQIFQNKDFRIGLSHAINREELRDTVWQRQGEPWQAAPLAASKYYDEEFAKQFTEHDVDLANEHLDSAGLSRRDGDGFRLGPDGKRLSFRVEVAQPALVPVWTDAMELVVGYWEQVGIEAQVKAEDRSLWFERTHANKHDALVWAGAGGFGDETLKTFCYFPSDGSGGAVLWAEWFQSRGADGEEPPAAPRQQMQLYWEFLEEPSERGRDDLFRQILEIAKEQFYVIGTIHVKENYGIVKNDFHNVPKSMWESATFSTPALTNPEQYFVEE